MATNRKRGWRRDHRLIPLHSAQGILELNSAFPILHVLEVGDLTCRRPGTEGKRWKSAEKIETIGFDWDDILRFREELHVRRRFANFRVEYADVLMIDDEDVKSGRAYGLSCGPGWESLLREIGDQLRSWRTKEFYPAIKGCKEKFGSLRVFFAGHRTPPVLPGDVDMYEPVQAYGEQVRRKSLTLCQECGQPGRLRMGVSICLTLCENHSHMVGQLNDDLDRHPRNPMGQLETIGGPYSADGDGR